MQKSFISYAAAALIALLTLTGFAVITPAVAQDTGSMSQELERLRRDLRDLQRVVYQGAEPPAPTAATSETLNEANAASQEATARLQLRIQGLEREMRNITGRFEEIGFQLNTLTGRLDRLVSDVDFRLQALERSAQAAPSSGAQGSQSSQGGQAGSSAVPSLSTQTGSIPIQPVPQAGAGDTGAATATQTVQEANQLQPGQQLLGQVSQADVEALQSGQVSPQTLSGATTDQAPDQASDSASINQAAIQQEAAPVSVPEAAPSPAPVQADQPVQQASVVTLPDGSEQEKYQYAYSLLRQDIASAEQAFSQFLAEHGEGAYAGNAKYWLAETHYARQDFRQAASNFLDAYTNYPDSPKASASLLKLGMSLGALGQKDAACATFTELNAKFPEADPRVLERAVTEGQRLGCS